MINKGTRLKLLNHSFNFWDGGYARAIINCVSEATAKSTDFVLSVINQGDTQIMVRSGDFRSTRKGFTNINIYADTNIDESTLLAENNVVICSYHFLYCSE